MQDKIESVAREAIAGAGKLIREHIGRIGASGIHDKGPSDYVTEVDRQCEDLILGLVRENFPDHHIMSEETASKGLQPGYTWVIDPLDGTTNFIHGFPFVAVSIAVCLEKSPVLGLVLDPIREELFVARKDGGAWLNGSRLQARTGVALKKALIATGFPFRQGEYLDDYLRTFKAIFVEVSDIRRAGAAALDLAYVAAGRVDGFWELGLKAWDIAAGELLVREAGGIVSDFHGEDNQLYSGNIIGAVPAVHEFLLDRVGKMACSGSEREEVTEAGLSGRFGRDAHGHEFLAVLKYHFHFSGRNDLRHYSQPECGVHKQGAVTIGVRNLVFRYAVPAGLQKQLPPVVFRFRTRNPLVQHGGKLVVVVAFFDEQVVFPSEIELVGLLEFQAGIVLEIVHHLIAIHVFRRHRLFLASFVLFSECCSVYWKFGGKVKGFSEQCGCLDPIRSFKIRNS